MTQAALGPAAALAFAAALGAAWLRNSLPPGLTLLERALAWLLLGSALAAGGALLLADLGALYPAALAALLVVVAAAGLLVTRRASHPGAVRPRPGRRDVALLALVAVLLVLALPPFEWVLGGRDPGTYVNAGLQMRAEHTTAPARDYVGEVPARVLPALTFWDPDEIPGRPTPPPPADPYKRDLWPGFYLRKPDRVLPQGFHLYPALLAAAGAASGDEGLWVVPVLAVLVLLACALLAGRLAEGAWPGAAEAGTGVALVAGLGFVWWARYPNAEMLAAALLVGGAWLWTLASRAGSRRLAAAAGALAGATLLTRPDAVILLPALALVALVLAILGRFGPAARWFGAGALATSALAATHAVAFGGPYLNDVSVHSPAGWTAIGAVLSAAALLAGAALRRREPIAAYLRRHQDTLARVVPIAALIGLVAVAAVGNVEGWAPLVWLRLHLGEAGLAAAAVGGAVLMARLLRGGGSEGAWLLLLLAAITLVLYLPNAHISPDLPWGFRRFLPALVPVWAILCGIALSAALAAGKAIRVVATLVTVVALAQLISGLAPTLGHREYDGAGGTVDRLDSLLGHGDPLVLFGGPDETAHLFGPAIGIGRGRAAFPVDDLSRRGIVDWLIARSRLRRVLLVTHGGHLPPLDRARLRARRTRSMVFSLPEMERPTDRLPTDAHRLSGTLVVWRLGPARP